MRFVSQVEWELLKRHTAAHLHDHARTHGDPLKPSSAPVDPGKPVEPAEIHYFSGNFPGQTGE